MDRATADIATYEASLKIAEAQLQLKKAPARQTDIDARVAAVNQARASLARASADYGNTVLTAPIAGRITKVHVKTGEFTPAGAAVTLLGNSPYRIEMFVSEVDVPKVQVTQSGSIELDAFRGTNFQLRVSEIDPASTDRDGVPKYRIKLDFIYPHDELKIGMTGDAVIVTGIKKDVISVPLRAVLEREDGTQYVRVMDENGVVTEKTVSTGLEGESGSIEVTGIEEGENVIVLEKS
jgi:HlyD family secretion protein